MDGKGIWLTGKCFLQEFEPFWGMVAGCVSATRELKAYLRDVLAGVVIRIPAVDLDSWIDDATVGGPPQ